MITRSSQPGGNGCLSGIKAFMITLTTWSWIGKNKSDINKSLPEVSRTMVYIQFNLFSMKCVQIVITWGRHTDYNITLKFCNLSKYVLVSY